MSPGRVFRPGVTSHQELLMRQGDPPYKLEDIYAMVEQCPRRKYRLRNKHIPGIVTWLLIMGARHEKALRAVKDRLMKGSVPGIQESIQYFTQAIQSINYLVSIIGEKFPVDDWDDTVEMVAKAYKIKLPKPDTVQLPPTPDETPQAVG